VYGEGTQPNERQNKKMISLENVNTENDLGRMYVELMQKVVNEIDPRLDAGSAGATKRKFTNDLVSSHESEWKVVSDDMVAQLGNMTPEAQAGNFYGLIRALTSSFKENVDKWIEDNSTGVVLDPSEVPSDAEKSELQEQRKELYTQIKTIISLAQSFNIETAEDWEAPVIRRGSSGKRGKRALSLYTWSIDGQPVDDDSDTPKGVSVLLGFDKAADFTKALKAANINTTSPDPTFTVTINGKEVTASRVDDDEDVEDDPTEPSTEDDDDE